MMKPSGYSIIVLTALLWTSFASLSGQKRNRIVSPEVSDANEMTFRLFAPRACQAPGRCFFRGYQTGNNNHYNLIITGQII
jgi:hypothetical protein